MVIENRTRPLFTSDSMLPARDQLLDTAQMAFRLGALFGNESVTCSIGRVKYRPRTSLRVLYRVRSGRKRFLLTARSFRDGRGFHAYKKAVRGTRNPEDVKFDKQTNTVFWKFPKDRKIRQLKEVLRIPRDICGITKYRWRENQLKAYAPEKCATLGCIDSRGKCFAYAKVFAGDEGQRVFRIYRHLKRLAATPDLIPNALAYSTEFKTVFVKTVEGELLSVLEGPKRMNSYRQLGESIARLHSIDAINSWPVFSRHSCSNIYSTLKTIACVRPDVIRPASDLARRLTTAARYEIEPRVLLHGDVHLKNAIRRKEGGLTLIDLDQSSIGTAAADIGSFLAALIYKGLIREITAEETAAGLTNFLEGYGRYRALPNSRSLRISTATAIFTERCGRSINRYRRKGLENLEDLLTAADQLLDGGLL